MCLISRQHQGLTTPNMDNLEISILIMTAVSQVIILHNLPLAASHEMVGFGIKSKPLYAQKLGVKKQSNLGITSESDNDSNPNILHQENEPNSYYRSKSKEKNFAIPSLKELSKKERQSVNSALSFKYSVLSGLEECDIPQTLRRMQDYLDKHETNPKQGTVIAFVNHLIPLCEETRSFDLEFHSKKMYGDLLVELRKLDDAKDIYKKLVFLADTRNKYKELMVMYQQIGY